MRTLRAQRLRSEYYALLEAQINDLLWETIYRPIVEHVRGLLPKRGASLPADPAKLARAYELRNAPGDAPLRAALRSGAVQMIVDAKADQAIFTLMGGKSSRALADAFHGFGATLNKTRGAYTCTRAAVPGWLRAEAAGFTARSKAAHDQLNKILDDIQGKKDRAVAAFNLFRGADHAVAQVAKGWKAAAKGFEVGVPELTDAGRVELARGMAETAKIPIKERMQEEVDRLRVQVEKNARQGYRAEGLVTRIRDEYAMSRSRAALIALQETANFMANYRAARAKDAGCEFYIWRCTRDNRVRPLHKAHNGVKYRYDAPPIIDERTGARGNPGQFPRCRCVDLPVISGAS